MGILDFLLGSDKKDASQEAAAAPDAALGDDIPAEHIAAIAAAISAIYTHIPAEHIVVIAAAIAAYEGTIEAEAGAGAGVIPAVNIQRGLNIWAMAGRQEAMAVRKLH